MHVPCGIPAAQSARPAAKCKLLDVSDVWATSLAYWLLHRICGGRSAHEFYRHMLVNVMRVAACGSKSRPTNVCQYFGVLGFLARRARPIYPAIQKGGDVAPVPFKRIGPDWDRLGPRNRRFPVRFLGADRAQTPYIYLG